MDLEIQFAPSFIRQFKKLPASLQDEVYEKVKLFKRIKNHKLLKVHNLSGNLTGKYSFSIDYSNRIVFEYVGGSKKEVALLKIGNHDIYK